MTRAAGCRVWDREGREYLDYVMALGAVALGYGHPSVNRAAEAAIAAGVVGPLPPVIEAEIADVLAARIPWMERVRFLKTGAEAVAAAVRLARVATGRDEILGCGYHGWLDWCQGATEGVPAAVRGLFEGTVGLGDPLAGPRLTVVGRAERSDDARLAARFAARHPASAAYAGFADFHLYRVIIERGHLVAGFGRIAWLDAAELRFRTDVSALAAAEADIVGHMNVDHPDAIAVYAERLLVRSRAGWRMTGIDPEGCDLRREGETARLDFGAPVLTPVAARSVLGAWPEGAGPAAPSR